MLSSAKFNSTVQLRWGDRRVRTAWRLRNKFLADAIERMRDGWTETDVRRSHKEGIKRWIRLRMCEDEAYVSLVQFVVDDLFPDHSCEECGGK